MKLKEKNENMDKDKIGLLELFSLQNTLSHPPDDSDDVLRSVMAQCSKWVEGGEACDNHNQHP